MASLKGKVKGGRERADSEEKVQQGGDGWQEREGRKGRRGGLRIYTACASFLRLGNHPDPFWQTSGGGRTSNDLPSNKPTGVRSNMSEVNMSEARSEASINRRRCRTLLLNNSTSALCRCVSRLPGLPFHREIVHEEGKQAALTAVGTSARAGHSWGPLW